MCTVFGVLFFKQKPAYEMRISDWSSDVCSSDLSERPRVLIGSHHGAAVVVHADVIERLADEFEIGVRPLRPRFAEYLDHLLGIRAEQRAIGRASWRERVCQYV